MRLISVMVSEITAEDHLIILCEFLVSSKHMPLYTSVSKLLAGEYKVTPELKRT